MSTDTSPLHAASTISVDEATRAAVHNAVNTVQQKGLYDFSAAAELAGIQDAARGQQDYTAVAWAIQRAIEKAGQFMAVLQSLQANVNALETQRARRERYSSRWWEQRRDQLRASFAQDPRAAVAQWSQTFAELLIAWELDLCATLVREDFPLLEDSAHTRALFLRGIEAIQRGAYTEAAVSGMLARLTEPTAEEGGACC